MTTHTTDPRIAIVAKVIATHGGTHLIADEAKAILAALDASETSIRTALGVATEVLQIASDWNAPQAYDIEVPASWDDTKDPDSGEPTWPTLTGIIKKCREALSDG